VKEKFPSAMVEFPRRTVWIASNADCGWVCGDPGVEHGLPCESLRGYRGRRERRETASMSNRTFWETIEVKGDQLLAEVKKLVAEGNVRKVRIRQHERTIVEFPLTVGVVGAVLAPILAAVGAVAALVTECTIDVQRTHAESKVPAGAGGREMDDQC
jgi:hypothetical protein